MTIKPLKDWNPKIGDVFKCYKKNYEYIYTIRDGEYGLSAYRQDGILYLNSPWPMERISTSVDYEDKWHLNTGEPIPEDADKLEKDGYVVAYRLVKEPEYKMYKDLSREEKLDLFEYWLDGNKIECKSIDGSWYGVQYPYWDSPCFYRKA